MFLKKKKRNQLSLDEMFIRDVHLSAVNACFNNCSNIIIDNGRENNSKYKDQGKLFIDNLYQLTFFVVSLRQSSFSSNFESRDKEIVHIE